jgi:hypothetical protein
MGPGAGHTDQDLPCRMAQLARKVAPTPNPMQTPVTPQSRPYRTVAYQSI